MLKRKSTSKLVITILASMTLSAMLINCANNPLRSYEADTSDPIKEVQSGQINNAIAAFSKNNYHSNDIMAHLELGSLYRVNGNYQASIDNLNFANSYINAWLASYNNTSGGAVVNGLQSGLINDKTLDYQVKDYEKVMLATYQALNNLNLNNLQNARIEIKRMYQLEDAIRQYRESLIVQAKNDASSNKHRLPKGAPSYTQFMKQNDQHVHDAFASMDQPEVLRLQNSYENAFSHYMAGFIFEALGEYDLAYPGYKRALELSPQSTVIKSSLANLSKPRNAFIDNNHTSLLIVQEIGHAPRISSQSFSVPFAVSSNNHNCIMALKVAFPVLIADDSINQPLAITINGADITRNSSNQPIANLDLMAKRYWRDNLPNVFITNMIHLARDYALEQTACNNGGGFASIAAIGLSQVLNSADERTWVMLPKEIYVYRVNLKRGIYNLSVGGKQSFALRLNRPYQVVTLRVMNNNTIYLNQ